MKCYCRTMVERNILPFFRSHLRHSTKNGKSYLRHCQDVRFMPIQFELKNRVSAELDAGNLGKSPSLFTGCVWEISI